MTCGNLSGGSRLKPTLTYRGKQGLYELAQKAMATTSGTFQEDVEDVLTRLSQNRAFFVRVRAVNIDPDAIFN